MKYSIISFWNEFCYTNNIFTSTYFKNHELTQNINESDILIVGSFVNDYDYNIIKYKHCIKILFITEPIEQNNSGQNAFKLMNENEFYIIFGCINQNIQKNLIKLPLYMLYFDYSNINIYIDTNRYVKNTKLVESKKDCCLINRHDIFGTRIPMYNILKNILNIECPSNLLNNCSNDELNTIGCVEYIKKFKFNLCPENTRTSVPGYITEKLLHCCLGGAIPIYYGYYDDIDATIFNKDRILFYDKDDNESMLNVKNKIVLLLTNPEMFTTFYNQDPFCNTAYDTLISLNNNFINSLNTIFTSIFNSQDNQDKYLEHNIFKGYKHGFYVDVGAHDGISINNTLYFEKYNNWSGINIEPIKTVFDKLINNRPNNINLNCAVCNNDGETEFLCNTGYTEMISGIKNTFDNRHFQRLQSENNQHCSTTELINVQTKKLETICDENNISRIHYLSIDVEGAEFEVIQSINFDKVFIDVIGFENNFNDTSIPIVNYLESKNYIVIYKSLDIFMIHKTSVFYKQ